MWPRAWLLRLSACHVFWRYGFTPFFLSSVVHRWRKGWYTVDPRRHSYTLTSRSKARWDISSSNSKCLKRSSSSRRSSSNSSRGSTHIPKTKVAVFQTSEICWLGSVVYCVGSTELSLLPTPCRRHVVAFMRKREFDGQLCRRKALRTGSLLQLLHCSRRVHGCGALQGRARDMSAPPPLPFLSPARCVPTPPLRLMSQRRCRHRHGPPQLRLLPCAGHQRSPVATAFKFTPGILLLFSFFVFLFFKWRERLIGSVCLHFGTFPDSAVEYIYFFPPWTNVRLVMSERWDPFSQHAEPMALLFKRHGIIPACQSPVKKMLKGILSRGMLETGFASCLVSWKPGNSCRSVCGKSKMRDACGEACSNETIFISKVKELLGFFCVWMLARLKGSFPKHEKKGLSRFLKPQSEVGVATAAPQLHTGMKLWNADVKLLLMSSAAPVLMWSKQSRILLFCAFNHAHVSWCGSMVWSDYGFKNPAQVHLEYKGLFSYVISYFQHQI